VDQNELIRLEALLREILEGSSLEWLLDEVDSAVAVGVPEEKLLQRRTRGGGEEWSVADEVGEQALAQELRVSPTDSRRSRHGAAYENAKRKGTLVISTRPMSAAERVGVLIEALRRVLVEVPVIEAEALKTLVTVQEEAGEREAAATVTFAPEQGPPQRRSKQPIELSDRYVDEGRMRLEQLLRLVETEVRS
jgi:hypothetical protein